MRVDDVTKWFVGGIVPDEFRPITDVDRTTDVDVSASKPGDPYFGPVSVTNGKYMVRARHGGVVERARGRIREFARSLDGDEPGSRNLMRLLAAWRATENSGWSSISTIYGTRGTATAGSRSFSFASRAASTGTSRATPKPPPPAVDTEMPSPGWSVNVVFAGIDSRVPSRAMRSCLPHAPSSPPPVPRGFTA